MNSLKQTKTALPSEILCKYLKSSGNNCHFDFLKLNWMDCPIHALCTEFFCSLPLVSREGEFKLNNEKEDDILSGQKVEKNKTFKK